MTQPEVKEAKMNIEELPIEQIIPYVNNAKEHPQAQVRKLASAIKEFGFLVPLVIDKSNVIISGHCRLSGGRDDRA